MSYDEREMQAAEERTRELLRNHNWRESARGAAVDPLGTVQRALGPTVRDRARVLVDQILGPVYQCKGCMTTLNQRDFTGANRAKGPAGEDRVTCPHCGSDHVIERRS